MSKDSEGGLFRRGVLKAGGALGATAVAGFPMIATGQARRPIKIGMPTILSGRVAQLGISSRNAVTMGACCTITGWNKSAQHMVGKPVSGRYMLRICITARD